MEKSDKGTKALVSDMNTITNKGIGKNIGDVFTITLKTNYFEYGEVLDNIDKQEKSFFIVGDIKEIYSKWYHRILYYITFKKLFKRGFKYLVKII